MNAHENFISSAGKDHIIELKYDAFDLSTTLHPSGFSGFFKDRKFDYFEVETLLNSSKKNLFFISPGKLSF